jgi:hypothetical protein
MGNWKDRFPSKYMKSSDLDDGPIDATIKEIVNETIGQGDRQELKPVLSCREKDVKGVVMNLTKMEAIATIAGTDDDDEWAGVKIRLQKGRTKYQGKTVACIEIVAPPKTRPASNVTPANRPPSRKPSPAPKAAEPDDPLPDVAGEDEEPF